MPDQFTMQRILTNRIHKALKKHHPVDVMGALQTYMCHVVIVCAADKEAALRGMQACYGDMLNTLNRHYDNAEQQPTVDPEHPTETNGG